MTPNYCPIVKALAHIEGHLHEKVTMQDLADASGYSLFHFTRLFNQFTGLTPYDYLVRRQLSTASEELVTSDRRIIDVAHDFGFGSHESFTRAFTRMFGIPPSQWREEKTGNELLVMPPLGEDYLFVLDKVINRKPTLVERDEMILLGWTLPVQNEFPSEATWRSLGLGLPAAERWVVRRPSLEAGMPALQFVGVQTEWKPDPAFLLTNYLVKGGTFLKLSFIQKGDLSQIPNVLVFIYHGILPKIKYRITSPLIFIHYTEPLNVMFPVEMVNKSGGKRAVS